MIKFAYDTMWWFRPVTLYRGLLFFDMMTFIFAFQVLCDGVYPKTWKVTMEISSLLHLLIAMRDLR